MAVLIVKRTTNRIGRFLRQSAAELETMSIIILEILIYYTFEIKIFSVVEIQLSNKD